MAVAFGLSELKLTDLVNSAPDEFSYNAFGRFDSIIADLDADAAMSYTSHAEGKPAPRYKAVMRVKNLIREFVLHGTLPAALSDRDTTG
ncbi:MULTISPECIES: hypothetical protein [unclassified Pseudoclavibacter]|uniref:hypothetical protein n=1 Tax=unclassified Pseudoclavibacter TaxID=2615177 RepID=UPI001BAB08DD|nr:hypothetical protein [Pseudoclavibacter sp. Marseille-Q4354]MBS3178355.1 hypothetical protein [Pseudoclavibacter sp. Marseille-Q4354]